MENIDLKIKTSQHPNYEKWKDTRQRKMLMERYGITKEQYNDMLIAQGCRCAFCGRHRSEFKRRLHVDHDHKTGKVRGLLCIGCNKNLVSYHNLETAKKLVEYLSK